MRKVPSPLKQQQKIVKVSESQGTGTRLKGQAAVEAGTANIDAAIKAEGTKIVEKSDPKTTALYNKRRAEARAKDAKTGKPATPDVFVPGEKKRTEDGVYHRNSESTQFSRERSNSLRAAKNASRKLYKAKKRGLTTTAWNEHVAKRDAYNATASDKDKMVVTSRKDWERSQKDLFKTNYRNRNAKAAKASYEGAQRQIDANKSVLNRESYAGKARATTTADNKKTVQNAADVSEISNKMKNGKVVMEKDNSNPNPANSMRSDGFFKGKSPLKKGYFK